MNEGENVCVYVCDKEREYRLLLFFLTQSILIFFRVMYEADINVDMKDKYIYATIEGNLISLKKRFIYICIYI